MTSLLFSEYSFAGLTLRNRVVMPPMATAIEGPGGAREDNGLPGPETIEYYRERARNGVGMIIVEHTYIMKQGKAHKGQLGLDNDQAIPAFSHLARAIRENGAVAAIQLNHVGAAGNPDVTGFLPLGPSDTPNPGSTRKPKAMTTEEIHIVQENFALAAKRAQEAGFDAVELHSAHGYLGTQFLSPLTNKREDEYGASLKNRARFLLETVRKIKEKVGQDYPLFVRLGTTDRSPSNPTPGFEPEDAAKVAKMLSDAGVALIDVSGGFSGSRPLNAGPGYFVPSASLIKKTLAENAEKGAPPQSSGQSSPESSPQKSASVLVTGGFVDPQFAEKVLKEGHADLIGIGRALLRDAQWVIKARKSSGQ